MAVLANIKGINFTRTFKSYKKQFKANELGTVKRMFNFNEINNLKYKAYISTMVNRKHVPTLHSYPHKIFYTGCRLPIIKETRPKPLRLKNIRKGDPYVNEPDYNGC